MSQFAKTCRQCFMEQGLTILLKQDQASGEWYCPMNRKHKTSNDVKSV